MSSSGDPERREEEEETPPVEDEDTGAPFAKLEEEDPVLDPRSFYRYDKGENQWKERGIGNVKVLKYKESGKARLVMRQMFVWFYPTMNVQEHSGNHKSCVWHASDFADGELKESSVSYLHHLRGLISRICFAPDADDFFSEKVSTPILDLVESPINLKKLSSKELEQLANEIRSELIFLS